MSDHVSRSEQSRKRDINKHLLSPEQREREVDFVKDRLRNYGRDQDKPPIRAEEKVDKYGNKAGEVVDSRNKFMDTISEIRQSSMDKAQERRNDAKGKFKEAVSKKDPKEIIESGAKVLWKEAGRPYVSKQFRDSYNRNIMTAKEIYEHEKGKTIIDGKKSIDNLESEASLRSSYETFRSQGRETEYYDQQRSMNASTATVWGKGLENELKTYDPERPPQQERTQEEDNLPSRRKQRPREERVKRGQRLEDMNVDDILNKED